jgi:DNA-binding transcriptional LysR family regulator
MKWEFDELRALVTLHDELHFGRAAAKLHLSQPALTKQIKRLESKLGGRLFNRSTGGVSVTSAGVAITERARSLLHEAESASSFAELAAHGTAGTLRIGFGVATIPDILPNSVIAFRRAHPHVSFEMRDMSTQSQVEALQTGSIDVGFVRIPRPEHDLQFVPIRKDELVLVTQAMSGRRYEKRLAAMRDEPFVLISRSSSPTLHNHVHEVCRSAGFYPRVIQEVEELFTLLYLVRSGLGVSLVPASAKRMRVPGLRFVSTGHREAFWNIGVAWSRKRASPLIENFVSVVRRTASSAAASLP